MSTQVSEIRRQIDDLDNKIHDLLMKRAELVQRIGKAKRESNTPIIQPAREAEMMRRLLKRHEGPLPKEAVVRIWRELVGAVSLLQTGLKVVVSVDPADPLYLWDMAKDYFSSVLPMKKMGDPLAALADVRDGAATFAVLPWPDDEHKTPWWTYITEEDSEQPMKIMARLPFGDRIKSALGPEKKAVVVARVSFEPSSQDRSFLALHLDESISRARIVDCLKELGHEPLSLYSHIPEGGQLAATNHFVEVDGYIGTKDSKLYDILKKLDNPDGRCVSLGGYPVPPVYEDAVGKGAEETETESKVSA